MNDRPWATVPKFHWVYTRLKDWMNMKIKASENPERRDKVRTMGSVRNILNGRIQVKRISLKENLSLKGVISSGP